MLRTPARTRYGHPDGIAIKHGQKAFKGLGAKYLRNEKGPAKPALDREMRLGLTA
jgi:hypothetical protein